MVAGISDAGVRRVVVTLLGAAGSIHLSTYASGLDTEKAGATVAVSYNEVLDAVLTEVGEDPLVHIHARHQTSALTVLITERKS
ncbi:hypothetical protein GCM10027169_16950 [Gordonia jinhuaensis]|uniref:Uncharacterized protein n=1 Tax=Gordonia jinhuaensis TaxID=1517702 RepID=A0A916X1S6_9ACTN|nr:hypothetical protein GCM10011489_38750 [Gordonia jinhuaensis]